MIESCVTVSLAPQATGGPFVLWGDFEASCRQAAQVGFDAVEVFPPGPEAIDADAFKETLARHNLRLAALGTGAGYLFHGLHLCDTDAARRQDAVRFISGLMDVAADFGAVVIIGSMQGRIAPTIERAQAEEWLRDGLDELGERGGECGVTVLLEPLNRYETNCVNRLDQGMSLVKSLRSDNVGLLADLFHMNIEEQSVCDALRRAAGYVRHVHFVDSNRRPAGLGHTDFAEVGGSSREIGYEGCVSAEALPYPTPMAAAEQTMRCFRRYVAQQ